MERQANRPSRRTVIGAGVVGLSALVAGRGVTGAAGKQAGPVAGHSDAFAADVAVAWFELLYDVVKAERTNPVHASRIYGLASVALYESVAAGAKGLQSLAGQLNDLETMPAAANQGLHWPTAANAAMARTVRGLYSAMSAGSLARVNGLEAAQDGAFAGSVAAVRRQQSRAFGAEVAAGVLDWAAGDGFAATRTCGYTPSGEPSGWLPTPPLFGANPLEPCWGELRPMALASVANFSPPGPPAFSTAVGSNFYVAADEVHQTGLGLTLEQRVIADYWSDGPGATGTPPGHWIAIVSQLAKTEALSLTRAAEAYARVGIAVHDAFICCWNTKYAYDLMRPVTYIRANIDAAWTPYIATPAFPSYTSGHSSQSGAAATVLADMFGEVAFTDTTHADHGLTPAQAPRSFASFEAAAAEAAISRLLGGIHYAFDNDDGLAAGRDIGQAVLERVTFSA